MLHNIEPTLLAIEALVTSAESHKSDFSIPKINSMLMMEYSMTPSMQAKEIPIEPVTKFQLYCGDVDDNGSFTPPEPLPDTMLHIEMMINDDKVSEYNQGAYMAIVEILSCPVANMPDKIIDLLNDIIDDPDETDEQEEEMVKTNTLNSEVPTLIDQNNDISDEELLAEYDKEKPEILQED